jgi:hypothetical protein
MFTDPAPQHLWLKRFVGSWTFEVECVMGPDQPPMKSKGRETVRMLGDLWLIAEGEGEMPGAGMMKSIMTIGYDPAKKKFVGSWVGSPSANLFVYEGDLKNNVLPLNTVGPSFTDPTKLATYQDIVELIDDNNRMLSSQTRNDDGSWTRFMTAHYRRV